MGDDDMDFANAMRRRRGLSTLTPVVAVVRLWGVTPEAWGIAATGDVIRGIERVRASERVQAVLTGIQGVGGPEPLGHAYDDGHALVLYWDENRGTRLVIYEAAEPETGDWEFWREGEHVRRWHPPPIFAPGKALAARGRAIATELPDG